MQNSRFQCLSQRKKSQRDACLKSADVQEVDMYVLEAKGFSALWVATQKKQGLSESQIDAKAVVLGLTGFIASNGSAMHDFKDFYLLAEDLKKGGSILSKYEVVQNGSKSYIKFKGNHKLRSLVKGTRYLSNNAQVIALGIGKAGMRASAKGGVIITAIFSVVFRTLESALTQNYSVTNWVVNVSSDIVKAAIAGAIGYMAGTFASLTGVILIPIFVGIIVAVWVANKLDTYEGRYLIKEKVMERINHVIERSVINDVDTMNYRINISKSMQSMKKNPVGMSF
ncbi:hypothetical protein [Vibrio tapetis]|uniref:Uncharacterized protein n=1 Tax=Vibrio tapetis subsp. tapetis TaxID=1671868 RepID=A0A2N8ZKB4_9VIBR|nr:hypothetical protein [Vibrio tapetis]SON52332.1 conserved protein of unknown function [Vibrio tapetis subsp. tapetis]